MPTHSVPILFVTTPFLPENQPALGISSLKSVLQNNGIDAKISYLNIDYGNHIGWDLNYYITRDIPPETLLGDVIFSRALWGDAALSWQEYKTQFQQLGWDKSGVHEKKAVQWQDVSNRLEQMVSESTGTIAQWTQKILAQNPRIVGFSTTFQQTVASLALAKELRRHRSANELTIIFGGANCESDMGRVLSEQFPFIDHVVSGEGENIILPLVKHYLESSQDNEIETAPFPRFVIGSKVEDMDDLPIPDFSDYFAAIKGSEIEKEKKVNLTAESSRGCWWGQKSHCTFCGLNGSSLSFRSKSPSNFASEICFLAKKHGYHHFMMADNILDYKYMQTFFPVMATRDEPLTLFYETKSNLKKSDLELMAAGGVIQIQPGIENLSTSILALMSKGTTMLQNLQLLKWSEEFNIHVNWNFLFGFPGENPGEYDRIADLMPLFFHFPPPSGFGKIRIDRFGAYWQSAETYGIKNMRPSWSYRHAFPGLSTSNHQRIAYFFQHDIDDHKNSDRYAEKAVNTIFDWHRKYKEKTTLEIQPEGNEFQVIDTRKNNKEASFSLTPEEYRLLVYLDTSRTYTDALNEMNRQENGIPGIPTSQFHEIIHRFLERQWIIEEGQRLFSLVLNRSQRQRVIDRRVTLKLAELGLTHLK